MLFNSLQFLIYFPIVVLFYYVIPDRIKYVWLLIASYYFYMCWNAKYALLIFASSIITYISGIGLEKLQQLDAEPKRIITYKKLTLASGFIINLLILFYFKYSNFIINIIDSIFKVAKVDINIPMFDIILPVGISFYTFQALGYTMDIYRGNIYAEKNFFKYALFVSFFPQLVAGPIERSKNLLKQLAVPHKFDFERAKKGILLMIWGFFLKIVLADRIAIFVDAVYGDYQTYIGWYVIFATILFALQIYCDFYGYSVIAMGTSTILGIQLMENFDAPYISTSVSGFWRKWHISLTSWFKDYLYIPLGGSRKGRLRKYINKLIVFLTSGLWHGAEFSFIVWGGLNGLYQIIGELLSPVKKRLTHLLNLNRKSFAYKLVQAFITFLLIDFSWIFFRATCLKEAFEIINQIFTASNMWIIFDGSLYNCGLDSKNFTLMIICILILIIADMCKCKGIKIIDKILKQDSWFQLIVVWSSIMAILLFGIYGSSYDAANFIYFQF